jgi:hypothetical protein
MAVVVAPPAIGAAITGDRTPRFVSAFIGTPP